jgi:predicted O-methyltransferase YrrM
MAHVVVAVPAYSSTIYLATFRSLLADITTLMRRGDTVSIIDECGSAYIDDTRAFIVSQFLKGDGDCLVSVDHDLLWEAGALVRVVDAPVDLCAVMYRKRSDPVEYPVRLTEATELWADPATGLLEVAGVPFGLIKCSRSMLERMVAHYPEQKVLMPNGDTICALFEPIRTGNLRLHEDFAFCERWRAMGGKVWVDPEVLTGHVGIKPYVGHWGSHLRAENHLSWKHCLDLVSSATETTNTYFELIDAWGNGQWAGSAKMLSMVADLARKANGPIIEFGSGLSTIVMRAACQHPMTVLEQDDEWAAKLKSRLTGHVSIIVADLVGDFYDTSFLPEKHYALAVLDGPLDGAHRSKAFPVLERVMRPGGIFVVDDLQFASVGEPFKAWAEGKANYETFEGDTRTFAIGMMHGG